jgi:hypothetical protein
MLNELHGFTFYESVWKMQIAAQQFPTKKEARHSIVGFAGRQVK